MHDQAYEWFRGFETHNPDIVVVELGSKIVQGTIRPLFEGTQYTGVDMQAGDGVDVVASAVDYQPDVDPDVVLCPEVFEHTPFWSLIIGNAMRILKPGGVFVATMAGPGRAAHGVNIDDPDARGWYENIQPGDLANTLDRHPLVFEYDVNQFGDDLRCWARKTPDSLDGYELLGA